MSTAHLVVYALGMVHASVCTDLPESEVAAEMNSVCPSGISSNWTISSAETFKTGEPNPSPCDRNYPDRLHYLMEC